MLNQVNNLVLDFITIGDRPISKSKGLKIKKVFDVDNSFIDIADIKWDIWSETCYIKTVNDHFQNYIVTYEDFKDFIRLVDDAYEIITLSNKPELAGKI